MKDRDRIFHEKWLGFAEPIEGLVFSVPALADAQIAPEERRELSVAFESQLGEEPPRIRNVESFFRDFLGYSQKGMLVPRVELPAELSFYAAEGGQEIRPSFALGRGPFASDDPFATFSEPKPIIEQLKDAKPWFALIWDLTESGHAPDFDEPEAVSGPWRYPPTAKFERLLRHVGIPVGFLFNGRDLRLVYAPVGESTGHLTFRVEHMRGADGRTLLTALDLLLHARRAYGASPEHTLEGLLAESRRRQADVTDALAKQVFEAVELLVAGFESAASRDIGEGRNDWLRAALEAEDDHFYQGVLSIVLRMVFLLYAEDQSLLPVEHPTYDEHLSLAGLYERLAHDAGAHPESMHHRFGAYGQFLSLFRVIFYGVKHGTLVLPPRNGRLFDPNAFPFLEGGLPGWTAAVVDPVERAAVIPPSLDDGTIYRVLHRLVVFHGQRLSYRALDVEQIGSVYESLMGYHVLRMTSPAVRIGKLGVWVESGAVRAMSAADRSRFFKETCGLGTTQITSVDKALAKAKTEDEIAVALGAFSPGHKADAANHRAPMGRLVLQPGEERRRTGSHYTPRSLTEKVVKRTLEPLLACLGDKRTPEQILQLKICDPAMGSGAFLVATCRELASEIVAAWTRQGELAKVIEAHGDAHLHARRLVAQQCLYGVDKNAAAVELAKLSLWLVTLSKTLPFTFVDHALRHGDSLVGLDFRQIEAFHWSASGQSEMCKLLLKEALDQAVELRQQILALANHEDPISQGEKRRLFEFSQQAIDRVRVVADACVGAFFSATKDSAREAERKRRLDLVVTWVGGERESQDESVPEAKRSIAAESAAIARAELQSLALDARKKLVPFHWWIEFPEVFFDERPDPLQGGEVNGAALMEGVVSNPPFMGGKLISGALGNGYRDWLLALHAGSHGNGDLSAHFFRRASTLLGEHGSFGLIATNTIAQGDTRVSGLRALLMAGFTVYNATRDLPWPGDAAVNVAVVHLASGAPGTHVGQPLLDGREVVAINSRLRAGAERADPSALHANDTLSSQGSKIYGQGFLLSSEDRLRLLAISPENGARIFPYLGGEEVNTSPTQSFERWVISFHDMTLSDAARWPSLLSVVEERVKPERDQLRGDNGSAQTLRKLWWRYQAHRPELYQALARMPRCLVTAQVTKHLCFSFQPTDRILSEKLYVFPLSTTTAFAILQSRAHVAWTWLLSSTMKADLNYSASDCFETFPFPNSDPGAVIGELETVGQTLYDARAKFMVDTEQGLTKTYNAIKDPACDDPRVLELRRMHEEMDRAVLDAYGWSDIVVPPYCPKSESERAAVQAFEDEVIDRLYLLNAERAREEERLGLGGKKAKKRGEAESEARPKGKRGKKPPKDQGKLF